jgi:hypothetical protein
MAGPLDGVEKPNPAAGRYGLPGSMPRYHGLWWNRMLQESGYTAERLIYLIRMLLMFLRNQ